MGRLDFPIGSIVYVDASSIIYSVERIEPYVGILGPLWLAADAHKLNIVTSALSLTECLIKPLRNDDQLMEDLFREFLLTTKTLRLISIEQNTLLKAAHIRAKLRLSTPDAIHAATALLARVTAFVTNDADFLRVSDLRTIVLSRLSEPDV